MAALKQITADAASCGAHVADAFGMGVLISLIAAGFAFG
jgi:hypothetical protein